MPKLPKWSPPVNANDLTEEELQVISEAIKEYIDQREESGEACLACNATGEDDDEMPLHSADCPVMTALKVREKLGIEID